MIIFPAKLEKLPEMLNYIKGYAESTGFNGDELHGIILSLEEALVNVISYAYPNSSGTIEIFCVNSKKNELEITIVDYGIPFDPLKYKGKTIKKGVTPERLGGYGISFIKKFMDKSEYNRIKDANILKLIKFKNSAK
jgi:anti-sigma regulatory factor (Ser/Thr protein kinase)